MADIPISLLSYADVNVNVLVSPSAAGSAAVTVFFSNADVFACIAVVTTGRVLLIISIALTFPSSALDLDSLVSLDFGGV